MPAVYQGIVEEDDPLYTYLKDEIQPQTGVEVENPVYDVYRLNGSNAVYLYQEQNSGVKIIGKYFFNDAIDDPELTWKKLEREYFNLSKMREFGFDESPYYVAKPYGKNYELDGLLTIEFCEGELLSSILERALETGDEDLIYEKLGALGHFFAKWHNNTVQEELVDFDWPKNYLGRMIDQVRDALEPEEVEFFEQEGMAWAEREEMWQDNKVIVHGDATPENFMFGDGENVISFDLERCMYADRIFDIGRMCAELFHFFLRTTGNKYEVEPFIRHFLMEYCSLFPDQEAAFNSITKRLPFYMGINLLRISRNEWLDDDYRCQLIYEARNCFLEGE